MHNDSALGASETNIQDESENFCELGITGAASAFELSGIKENGNASANEGSRIEENGNTSANELSRIEENGNTSANELSGIEENDSASAGELSATEESPTAQGKKRKRRPSRWKRYIAKKSVEC